MRSDPLDGSLIDSLTETSLAIDRVAAEHSLYYFVQMAWPILEPATPFRPGKHIEAICLHLEACFDGRIRNLLINVPPRCSKSLTLCVFFPAWVWGPKHTPSARFLFTSYSATLSIRDSVKCRRLILSPWYQARWGKAYAVGPETFEILSEQNQKVKFENDHMGYRIASSVGGANTGEGGDYVICDDAHSVLEAESDAVRQSTVEWWHGVMSTRRNNPKTGRRIVCGQRVHEADISGSILEKNAITREWVHLKLPAEWKGETCITYTDDGEELFRDWRTTEGELLWENQFGRAELESLKADLGPYQAAAQLQQDPAPLEGGLLKKHHWRFWHVPGEPLPPVPMKLADGSIIECPCEPLPWEFDQEVQSWDTRFREKDVASGSYVVGQHWGKRGARVYCLSQVRGQWGTMRTVEEVRALHAQFRLAGGIVIENKASGPAVAAMLREEIPGLLLQDPRGDKFARATAYAKYQESGQCFLPHPTLAPWVDGFLYNCAIFPNGRHDDEIDAWSQAMTALYGKTGRSVPIFPDFDRRFYFAPEALKPVMGLNAFRCWVDGLFPTCILGQITAKGKIIVLDCVQVDDGAGVEELIDRKVVPLLRTRYRGVFRWRDIGNFPTQTPHSPEHTLPQIVNAKLQSAMEAGEPSFQARLHALQTIFAQTGRLTFNPMPTQGELRHHLEKAFAEGQYGYLANADGVVVRHEPQPGHPSTAVGDALGHGMARLFTRVPPKPPSPPQENARARARSYGVRMPMK